MTTDADATGLGLAPSDATEIVLPAYVPAQDYPSTGMAPVAYTVGNDHDTSTESYDSRSDLTRWAVLIGALVLAMAALIFALTNWVRVTGGASPSVIWQAPAAITKTETTRTITLTQPDQDTAFLQELEMADTKNVYMSGHAIHDAKYACAAIIAGNTRDQAELILVKDGYDPGDAKIVVQLAVKHYCPGGHS